MSLWIAKMRLSKEVQHLITIVVGTNMNRASFQ